MKKNFLFRVSIILVFLFFLAGTGVAQVDIRVSIFPPFPAKVSEYASHPQQVLIVLRSLTNLPQDIQLRGSITGDNGVGLRVDPNYKSPQPIHLNGGETRNLNANDITQLFDYNTLIFTGIGRDAVIRGNGLPEGSYQVCVQAFNYNNNQPLSQGQPLGCSNAFPISSVEPPVILTPVDEQSVSALTTQNFVISWSTPPGAPPSTQYTVTMVEMLDNRNPNDAINSATSPLFFQQTVSSVNLLLYGPQMPSLTPGRRYALMVAAKDPFNSVTFRNNGRSIVTSFVYGDPGSGAGSNTGGTGNGNNSGSTTKLPSLAVKGRLSWYYRKSEETAPTAPVKFTPPSGMLSSIYQSMGSARQIVNTTLQDPTFVAGVQPTNNSLSGNQAASGSKSMYTMAMLKTIKPSAPIVPSATKQVARQHPFALSITGTGYGAFTNVNDPANFSTPGREAHPMNGTVIKLLAVDSAQPGGTPQLAGAGVTDDQGNFQISFVPPAAFGSGKGFKYFLSVQNNYFGLSAPFFSIPENSMTAFDLGEITALANTYRLVAFADDESRAELTSANISVYRRADFYAGNPSLKTEGNIDENNRPVETINGQQYVKICSINDAYTGTRLFYSGGSGDEYKIKVTASNYSDDITAFSVATVVTSPTAPQTLQEIFQMATAPTSFTGMVSQTTGGQVKQAIAGAEVTLYLNNNAYRAATQSNSQQAVFVGTIDASAGQHANPTVKKDVLVTNKSQPKTMTDSKPSSGSGNGLEMKIITPAGLVNGVKYSVNNGQMVTTTDSSGAFLFSNVPPNDSAMHYIISVPGTSLVHADTVTLAIKGAHPRKDYTFNFIAYAVTGRVVDEAKNAIPNAMLHWASGGAEFQANETGYFATTTHSGTDTLIAHALGFQDQRQVVSISYPLLSKDPPVASSGSGNSKQVLVIVSIKGGAGLASNQPTQVGSSGNSNSNSRFAHFVSAVQNTDAYKQSASQGNAMDAKSFGFRNAKNDVSWAGSMLNGQDDPTSAVTVPDIIMKKYTGRMLISVVDAATGNPIAKAAIQIDGTDSTELTGTDGSRFIQGPAGDLQLIVGGPSGSNYAPQEISLSVSVQDTTRKIIKLETGISISGLVTASGKAAAGAVVAVDGLDFLSTTTNSSGNYHLVVPKNTAYTYKASESGFVSATQAGTYSANTTVNFTLGTASFNISRVLGFSVQIDKIEDVTATQKKISGSFINLPGNDVFTVKSGVSLPFTDALVNIVNNAAVPVNGKISTDVTNISMTAFKFLPVLLANGNGSPLEVSQNGPDANAGQIQGMMAIDYKSFVPAGIAPYVDASLKQYVQTASSSTPQVMTAINSNGTLTAPSLAIAGTGSQSFNLYGFTVTLDLGGSAVKTDGLHLKGSVNMGSIPLLGNTTFQINDLWIGSNGYVKGVSVNMSPAPSFSIAGWSGALTGLSFNDNGFSISGNLKVTIPGSRTSEIDFANLSISTDQLYGGSFTIPSSGIDVFGVVKFVAGPTPLSFGKLGSSNVYYIGGSGSVKFPSLFDDMTLQFFQIQTNGQFAATVQTNINEDFFGVAQVAITDINFHTNNGIGVDVGGNFLLSGIPFIKASVGGVHFGTGGSVTVDQIGLSFSMVGIATVSANLDFVNQPDKKGFSGAGSITIAGLPGANVSFSYYKVPNGFSVSAFFQANVVIPIAGIASINNPGGGFSLNTGEGTWAVTITGSASITGLQTAVEMKDITLTVTNGPVITGTAGLNVMTINVANAKMVVDVPKTLFSLTLDVGINILPQIVTAEGSATFVASGAKGDTYFMIAAQYKASLLGIFNENANIAAGWGMNIARHPEYAEYTSFIPSSDGTLSGIYLKATSDIDFEASGDIYIASGKIWYKNYGQLIASMGLQSGNYNLDIAASWDCGGSLGISGLGTIASLDIGSDVGVHLSYMNGCFSAGGNLAGHLTASIGNCDDDCFTGLCMHDLGPISGVVPEGGKICAHPGLDVGYDCTTGFHLSIDL